MIKEICISENSLSIDLKQADVVFFEDSKPKVFTAHFLFAKAFSDIKTIQSI